MPAACIFAITGYTSVFDLLKCREAGFDDYFPKPFEVALLDKAVNDVMLLRNLTGGEKSRNYKVQHRMVSDVTKMLIIFL